MYTPYQVLPCNPHGNYPCRCSFHALKAKPGGSLSVYPSELMMRVNAKQANMFWFPYYYVTSTSDLSRIRAGQFPVSILSRHTPYHIQRTFERPRSDKSNLGSLIPRYSSETLAGDFKESNVRFQLFEACGEDRSSHRRIFWDRQGKHLISFTIQKIQIHFAWSYAQATAVLFAKVHTASIECSHHDWTCDWK